MSARREIGKWLNEEPNRELDRKLLAELCADYDALEHLLTTGKTDPQKAPKIQDDGSVTQKDSSSFIQWLKRFWS